MTLCRESEEGTMSESEMQVELRDQRIGCLCIGC